MNAEQEKVLRENIKQLIEVVKQKKENKINETLNEEKKLRKVIRDLVDYELKTLREATTPDNEPTPNKSTGINVLEDLSASSFTISMENTSLHNGDRTAAW